MLKGVACGNGQNRTIMTSQSEKRPIKGVKEIPVTAKATNGGVIMLGENIKSIRKSKGLSQQELAVKLNVVRQTVSKWEQGLSVPDSDMLISLSEALETPVSVLLGETLKQREDDDTNDLKAISRKLEVINLQLAQNKNASKKGVRILLIVLLALTAAIWIGLIVLKSQYLTWNLGDPETAVYVAALHAFEYIFVRISPFLVIALSAGLILSYKNR